MPVVDDSAMILALNCDDVVTAHDSQANQCGRGGLTRMVTISEDNHRLSLAVTEVVGEEDVIIKPIADSYRNVSGLAGASILGDSRDSLIVDPTTLIDMSYHPRIAMAGIPENIS